MRVVGFLLAIGRDARMRFGCIIEQEWMHVPDADARVLDQPRNLCPGTDLPLWCTRPFVFSNGREESR